MEDRKKVYEVEFYLGANEYDYENNAVTGTILSSDCDIEGFDAIEDGKFINEEKVKKAALSHTKSPIIQLKWQKYGGYFNGKL